MAMTPVMKVPRSMVALLLASAACHSDAAGPQPEPLLILLVSGDNQSGVVGGSLASPFVVQVRNSRGEGAAGIRVSWTVVSGAGMFSTAGPTVSGGDGTTQVVFTPLTARAKIRAALEDHPGSSVQFKAVPPVLAIYDRLSGLTGCSVAVCERLTFYSDRTFGLSDWGSDIELPGTYVRRETDVALNFDVQKWLATGTVRGDSLVVEYDIVADMEGFEGGIFRLTQGQLPSP